MQAYTRDTLVAAWNWTAASHNLWFLYLHAIRKAIWATLTSNSHPVLQVTMDTLQHEQVAVIPFSTGLC